MAHRAERQVCPCVPAAQEIHTPALVKVVLMEPQVVQAKRSMPFSLDIAPFAGCEPQCPQTQQVGIMPLSLTP